MLQGITIESHCTCKKCGGKGYTELRCKTIITKKGNVLQCIQPATHEVDGIFCCYRHFLDQYRRYKKEINKWNKVQKNGLKPD